MSGDYPAYEFDPRKLPADLLRAVGFTVACSVQTESMVDAAIAVILGSDVRVATALTAQHGLPARISMLRSIAHETDLPEDLHEALEFAIKQVEKGAALRNQIVHRTYFIDPHTGDAFSWKITAKKRIQSNMSPVSIPSIEADALFILKSGLDLSSVVEAIEILRQRA